MPASYPTSVKSFSSKLSGDLIALSHMTDLQDEVVAVETALVNGLPVTHGGSGRLTATTAYSVIAAGTTATGAQQSIAPSTSGFVLTDNGVGVLPSFQVGKNVARYQTAQTANYTVDFTNGPHQTVLANTNAFTVTLPTASRS